ncbi:hypothetical protein [Marinobacter shengliensis]|uniref:hypothetical protein n=1 Tax=Marinobacter shengliensis TaxID=1389223 RepID=UPI001E486671|nr:hypothetical protein [Marinobacter shengliensis]MCD1631345.1 hypothetical protein [Marinobacter shengliensis]
MNVSIAAPLFDLDGHVLLTDVEPEGLAGFERRNNRIPTLDGGAAIPDFGYSDADRTLDIRWPAKDKHQVDTIRRLAKTYSRLIVATEEGCFIGAPGPFAMSAEEAQIQILVEKRIDQ